MYSLHSRITASFALTLMGTIDCLTTVIGVLFFGAVEMNPFLAGIVSSNIFVFVVLKISATLCVASTYVLAKKTLNSAEDKTSRSFKMGDLFIKMTFSGIFMFLTIVVANNVIILLS